MGWTSEDEPQVVKKEGIEATTKVLIGIMCCLFMIIIVITIILFTSKEEKNTVILDGKGVKNYSIEKLTLDIDGKTYIDIKAFSELVGYEYHKGEYKSFSNEDDRCYITGQEETATFYLDKNKVNKLPINSHLEEYREHIVEEKVKIKNDIMYAPIRAMEIGCNVQIYKEDEILRIYTLNYCDNIYNNNAIKWGYTSIKEQSFENKKALLYDRLIVKKEGGLYKIIDCNNTKEIVPDKYTDIQFLEVDQNFIVTSSFGKMGIINLEGDVLIEPKYDNIHVLDKEQKLYVVEKDKKFGIVKRENEVVIPIQYDSIGCDISSIEINGVIKKVNPVTTIDACEGIVVKENDKYGVINIKTNTTVVPFQVDSIYSIENNKKELEYFMLYNGEELNIINMLIEQGIIKNPEEVIEDGNTIVQDNNTVITNSITNTVSNNIG